MTILATEKVMTRFALLLAITFCLIFGFAWLIIFCRRRLGKSRHHLTGMCHHNGGPMCGHCREGKGEEACPRPTDQPQGPPG